MKLNIGQQIRLNRLRLNLTQEELAEKFGTSPQSISRWENGNTYPDIEMLPSIASFFGMSVDSLLGRTQEEKEAHCKAIENEFKSAVSEKNIEKTIELLREIRRDLREYNCYWFWGLYSDLQSSGLFLNGEVLSEMRMLAEEIFKVCPRDKHFDVIEKMAEMEDEEHIDGFLRLNASREDMGRFNLLLARYIARKEMEKIDPIRQYVLWHEIDNIVTRPILWQEYNCDDPTHYIWYCETQLNYLNAINVLTPDKDHIVSGGNQLDLWCEQRVSLGLRYTAALSKLGDLDNAYKIFEDTIRVIERVMENSEDEIEVQCTSPAFEGYKLKGKFHWIEHFDGMEYRDMCIENNDWANWIYPRQYQNYIEHSWFDSVRADSRFDELFARLDKCVIRRDGLKDSD